MSPLGAALLFLLAPALLVDAVPQRLAYNINPGARLIRVEERAGSRDVASAVDEPAMADEGAVEGMADTGDDAREDMPAVGDAPLPLLERGRGGAPDTFPCGQMVAAADVPADTNCSQTCPYWAESALKEQACQFKCVTEQECGVWGEGVVVNASIADPAGYCRRCRMPNCNLCRSHMDECVDCAKGYHLMQGSCVNDGSYIAYGSYALIFFLFCYIIMWYIEVRCRPVVNQEGVERGLKYRSLTKLRLPRRSAPADARTPLLAGPGGEAPPAGAGGAEPGAGGATRPLWPLTTNLLKEPAGGVGTTLMFRFQCYWILWGLFALILWCGIAAGHNKELFVLGIEDVGTPRELCRLVVWGTTMLRENMHIKVRFMASLYGCSVVLSVGFAILQARMHKHLDKNTTMKDYAAMVYGLPKIPGSVQVEKELQDLLQEQTGEHLVGVSVCWDIVEKGDTIRDVLEEDIHQLEEQREAATRPPAPPPAPVAPGTENQAAPLTLEELDRPITPVEYNGFRWKFFGFVDRLLLMVLGVPRGAPEEEVNQATLATEMETTPFAFAVFDTELARDKAVYVLAGKGGAAYKDGHIRMKKIDSEPESVRWLDMGYSKSYLPLRVLRGCFFILLALGAWVSFFYLPYVFYMAGQEYDATNQSPDTLMFFILTFVVVGGAIVIYCVCAAVAESMHFHFTEDTECSYLIFYLSSVVLNVALDMMVASWISYKAMVSAGAHTFGGKFLGDTKNIQEIYESYPVQKNLGYQLFGYCFPATFLLPFVAEPLALIWAPYHLMKLVVRSNPTIKGWRAEKAMAIFAPQDSGRYGDVLVNVLLTVLVCFAPGGWFAWMFGALIISNIYIYLYDQYKVLRCVPSFTFSNNTIDKFALNLSVLPCGIVLSCVLLKANCMKNGHFCVGGSKLTALCVEAFVLHCIFHMALLTWIPPLCVPLATTRTDIPYADAAKGTGSTWFSNNPAYCLRSKMVYKHSPPCPLYVKGKEHVMPTNPAVGQHFQDTMPEPEKY